MSGALYQPGKDAADGSGRLRAPGSVGLVQALVNSLDIEAGIDHIASGRHLGSWLDHEGLARPAAISDAEAARVRDVREALRSAIEGDDSEQLTRAVAGIALYVASSPDGPVLVPAGAGIDAALATILAAAIGGVADGTWARLKICRNDRCRWAYWDASRNRSGVWCTMAVCGNRAKGRAYRRRGRPSATD